MCSCLLSKSSRLDEQTPCLSSFFMPLINQTPKLIHEGFQAQASPALGLLLMQDWGFRGIKVAGLCLILLP